MKATVHGQECRRRFCMDVRQKKLTCALLICVAAAECAAPARAATPTFAAPVSYNTGTQGDIFVPNAEPAGLVTGIFRTGSGKLDIIEAHGADNSLYYLAGNGDGTFKPAVKISISENIGTIPNLLVGDLNNDGNLDLFLPSGDLSHPIVLLGRGDGTFGAPIDSSSFVVSGAYARGWALG